MKKVIKYFLILAIISAILSCALFANQYSSTFIRGGYYICYDGVHYKYACYTSETVTEIIRYYYPDCFDVTVYEPGTPETGYLNTIFFATWKSYLNETEIK